MKTVLAVLLACACALGGAANAGLLGAPTLSLSGASTGTVGPVGASSPNNDNSVGANPNGVPFVLFLNAPGGFETVFTVTNTGGTTEYIVTQTLVNNSGAVRTGFRFELGFGTGSAFSSSLLADELDFDAPTLDPFPPSSGFPVVASQADLRSGPVES